MAGLMLPGLSRVPQVARLQGHKCYQDKHKLLIQAPISQATASTLRPLRSFHLSQLCPGLTCCKQKVDQCTKLYPLSPSYTL
uniref:Uncharacterized protein n=1 Tax=Rhizophora mucronata TaxID=61149 RepID=A0A2P2IUJ1_RHIMU